MSTREQFGNYLLLKKLAEDPLGETFRAGMLGAKGMERVALLRVMNGQGIDGQRLWATSESRAPIQTSLRSPSIGDGIEIGEVHGIPYAAYDYVSGKNLAVLMEKAREQRNPIATDHALLITERLALALSVAAEHRHDGNRILHGFLAPHLVMISNEGETKLLGFEYAVGLRSFVSNPVLRRHFGRYLAPEALGAGAPARSDDIYSLGVVLFELLTGQPLPPQASDGYAEVIDRATLAAEDRPIPDGLAQLLKSSLVPAAARMQDVGEWHKALAAWISQGDYSPTTFNLAFYMHNLYRQDIERESQEIEVEKTLPVPVATSSTGTIPIQGVAAAAAATAASDSGTGTGTGAYAAVSHETGSHGTGSHATGGHATGGHAAVASAPATDSNFPAVDMAQKDDKERSSSKLPLWLGLAALLLIGLGAAYYFTSMRGGGAASDSSAATAAGTLGADAATPAEPTLTPEEIAAAEAEAKAAEEEAQAALQTQIDDLVAQKASEMENQLRTQMDSQLDRLRGQLDDAKQAAADREDQLEQQRQDEAARVAAEQEAERLAAEAAAQKAADEEAARLAAEAAAQKAADEEAARLAAEAAEAAKKPTYRRGDLVEPGPGISSPKMVRFPPPRFPQMARRLNRSDVTVPVRVLVDENGKVIDAKPSSPKKLGFGFDEEALNVARGAEYRAATAEGVPVKMWVMLNVRFQSQ